jgi:DNA-binding NtrC family response regulator
MSRRESALRNSLNERRLQRPRPVAAATIKIGKEPRKAGNRVEVLKEIIVTLLSEVEALEQTEFARETAFSGETQRLDIAHGIDFYDAVRRFEINLIRLALKETGGNQTRAARLLNIRVTTLHNKIKLYQI